MAFNEVRFPVDISYGSSGGPMFKTSILTLSSGHEKRNEDWELVKAKYDVAQGIKTDDQIEVLQKFFYNQAGRAFGFRFKDWLDYILVLQLIGTTDGSTAVYQIFKRYTFGPLSFDRPLTKIVADVDVGFKPLIVKINAVVIDEGGAADEFTIDRDTGLITIGSTHAATSSLVIEVECEFDVPVRFDTDHLNVTKDFFNTNSWPDIPLVEVRDIT